MGEVLTFPRAPPIGDQEEAWNAFTAAYRRAAGNPTIRNMIEAVRAWELAEKALLAGDKDEGGALR